MKNIVLPDNIDPRPNRRIHRDNQSRLYSIGRDTANPRYFIAFIDGNGIQRNEEITEEMFLFLDSCELDDLSRMNEEDRHADKTELTPYLMNIITNQSSDPLFDIASKNEEIRMLHMAIMMLPDIQRRRLLMHYWGKMTCEQIGEIEGCAPQTVHRSIDKARCNLKKILKNFV